MDKQRQEALDDFLADVRAFQENPLTGEFHFCNMLELSTMNPATFESDHKSRQDNTARAEYGRLLRRIRSAIGLLFDEGHDPIEEAVEYIREKAGIEFTSLHHPRRNQALLKLNNGFQLMHFWMMPFGHRPSDNTGWAKQEPAKVAEVENVTKVRDYTVVDENDIDRFTKSVNSLIQAGWQPLGGVSTTSQMVHDKYTLTGTTVQTTYVQAMVK